MPTTSENAIRYPAATATPNVSQDIQNVATDVDTGLVRRFASTGARDTAIPSPATNRVVSVAGAIQVYTGSRWATALVGTSGSSSGSTDASGNLVVNHGLGTTPTRVLVSATVSAVANIANYVVTARSSTTFTVTLYNSTSGAVIGSNPASFEWIAI